MRTFCSLATVMYVVMQTFLLTALIVRAQKCLKPNVKAIIWDFMARYCRPCKKMM